MLRNFYSHSVALMCTCTLSSHVQAIKFWNHLPQELTELESLKLFREGLNNLINFFKI